VTIPVSEVVRLCKLRLEPVAGEEALQQAKEIVAAVIGAETSALAVHSWVQVTEEQMSMIGDLVEQRLSGQPLQYILGEWEFYGLPFYVDERALIPRQDTELLVETAISMIQQRGYQSCFDLCTGSGCIAVSIAKHAQIPVTASDISVDALELAQENAALNEVRVAFVESDLFDQIDGKFDLICCNPPYLTKDDMEHLQKEVSFEPALALYGGADGLDFYRKIAKEYQAHLNAGGALLLEIGSTQAETAAALFAAKTSVLNDLAGNPRVLVVEPN
jgi:release factor glutamine methyltransferase